MTSDSYRRHVATRREIVFIEVPVAGSPQEGRRLRPGPYKRNQLEPWKPATRPPSKAERIARWLDQCRRQQEAVREMLTPNAALLKAWWSGAAIF